MKILDYFRKPRPTILYSPTFDGFIPGVSQGHKKYTDDILVQSCIQSIASEISKLTPHHVKRTEAGEWMVEHDALERVLTRPNAMMTMTDMLFKLIWNLFTTSNAFVLPVYDKMGNISSMWPIPVAEKITFQDQPDGTVFISFDYGKVGIVTLKYDRIIHIRRNFTANDYLGGDETGNTNVKGLNEALKIQNYALSTVEKNLALSSGVLGILHKKTKMAETSLIEAQESFRRVMESSSTGLVAMGNDIDYIPLDRKPVTIPTETTKFLEARILRYFGISTAILSGDFTKVQYAAFYQKTLEPICISLSQAFTKALFTVRESTSYGHEIRFYANETIFMEESQKFELVRLLGDHGGLMVNEIRDMFGLAPLPELVGERFQSLNYVNTKIAAEYQLGQKAAEPAEDKTDSDQPADDDTESKDEA